MRLLSRKAVSFFVLVAFLAGIAMYGVNPAWLKHELDHSRTSLVLTADYDDVSKEGAGTDGNSKRFSNAEHKLLHSLSQCAHAPCVWQLVFAKRIESSIFPPIFLILVHAEREPLLRPPRGTLTA